MNPETGIVLVGVVLFFIIYGGIMLYRHVGSAGTAGAGGAVQQYMLYRTEANCDESTAGPTRAELEASGIPSSCAIPFERTGYSYLDEYTDGYSTKNYSRFAGDPKGYPRSKKYPIVDSWESLWYIFRKYIGIP